MTTTGRQPAAAAEPAAPRSCLVVPASSARKIEKARTCGADEVVLDLEDAVVPAAKDDARRFIVDALTGAAAWRPAVSVRINAPRTPWCHADVIAIAMLPQRPQALVVPKVESDGDLLFIDRLLDGVEAANGRRNRLQTQALIETARGLSRIDEIAACSERLTALVVGYADLAVSLGRPQSRTPADAWDTVRQTVVTSARANELHVIDGPYLGIHADAVLRTQAQRARCFGFDGKWVIHPGQIEAVNEVFSPTSEELVHASRVLEALTQAAAGAQAGAVALDGEMLDEPARQAALRVLASARGTSPH